MEKLIESIKAIVHLNEVEISQVKEAFTPKSIAKGDFLIQEGQYCQQIAFILSGRLRIFYLDEKGNEITCYFVKENEFVSSYTSFLTHTPTRENIEAIEPTQLLVIDREPLEQLSKKVPKVHIWRRVIAENLFIYMERRISMLQSQSALERYEATLRNNPDLLLKVPLQYTASFLGITPQHLSRLRKSQAK